MLEHLNRIVHGEGVQQFETQRMPEMSGIELARQIRRLPEIAATHLTILSSAARPVEAAELIAELKLCAFLATPVKRSDLFDCIVKTLNLSALWLLQLPQTPRAAPAPSV